MMAGYVHTVGQLLGDGARKLGDASASPRLDAELLLGHLLSFNRLQLIMNVEAPVPHLIAEQFFQLIDRRGRAEPVAYLIGEKEFYGLPFAVSPDVLVPRPETEILVEAALREVRSMNGEASVLDLGTGSGAIAVALAVTMEHEKRPGRIVALDKSAEALEVARGNARRNGVEGRVEFLQSDWFAAVSADARFDLILSNPPYIAEGDSEVSAELQYEPAMALYAEHDGLADIGKILSAVASRSHLPTLILIEIGSRQGQALVQKLRAGEFGVPFQAAQTEILSDLAGLPRVLKIRLRQ